MNDAMNRGEGNVLKGLVAGLVGGLVASWTMNRFQEVWAKLSESQNGSGNSEGESQLSNTEEQDDTTVRTASAISEGLFDHRLTQSEKRIGGPTVHYSLGTCVGGLYGAVAEVAPEVTSAVGLPFGAAFWLVVDEVAVPLLGLSKGPTKYPVSTHVYALTSHFVYGLTTEAVRRLVRKAL